MDKIKELLSIIFGSCLQVQGRGRTYVKAPIWLAVIAALSSLKLTIITALLVVAFGMQASIVKN